MTTPIETALREELAEAKAALLDVQRCGTVDHHNGCCHLCAKCLARISAAIANRPPGPGERGCVFIYAGGTTCRRATRPDLWFCDFHTKPTAERIHTEINGTPLAAPSGSIPVSAARVAGKGGGK